VYPIGLDFERLAKKSNAVRPRTLYVIRNSRLDPEWAQVERKTLSIAGRAISALIHTQGVGDLYRIYLTSQRDGLDFNLAYIPASFDTPKPSEFEPGYMGALFRTGFDLMQAWADLPIDADGLRHVTIAETERLELWFGGAVDAGYLVANGTLRDLPVGASHKGAQFAWVPPAGYVGTYHLAFIRGSERIDVAVTVGGK